MTSLLLSYVIQPLILIVSLLLAVAFLTLVERKILGHMQARKGPNVVGPCGLLQPFADGVKLFIKEPSLPSTSSSIMFTLAPMLAFTLALTLWALLPMPLPMADFSLNILFILAISSLAVYSILGSGWASNSKYALIGALRAVAQTISYEVSLGLILLSNIILSGGFTLQTFNITQEAVWLILPSWPLAAMWFVSTLAETNRAPFDLTEGESELVSGFNVEYSGGLFALFFLAEYANILFMSALSAILFLGSSFWSFLPAITTIILMAKATFLAVLFVWVRASYPRYRYDQLMHLIWKNFLPLALALLIWNLSLPISFAGLPPQF
uniref:NADH dehydrogenase subunit 1 n=1 Tax=Omobranchus fasciolatoceps TaxID=57835 RepID=UPI001EDE0E3D|nr:NADH dehydrogenase subunit 1 [Omobranchus fasciolatoceps]UHY39615.1 NADH dehydrogenase subunit 1 [Omobranchus fasciolatoceps]URH13669.1 NADH dehydrogenase subunit 1 [Omobranchus fasciolatoceps]